MTLGVADIGNSFIKVCLFPPGGATAPCGQSPTVEDAVEFFVSNGVDAVAFCTTRDLSDLERSLCHKAGWWEFGWGCRLPIRVRYDRPELLGADRLAAAVGAWKAFPGETVLVADAGTALTLDLVSAGGEFLGGNISAGIKLRMDALHNFTSRLPRVDYRREDDAVIGTDTESAILRGARCGVAAEVAGMYRLASRLYGCSHMVLTGGAAPEIYDLTELFLAEGEREGLSYDPLLLARGLREVYLYNHDKEV